MSSNLWPTDLVASPVRSPVSILREQAAFLENNTNNIVSALVQKTDEKMRFIGDVNALAQAAGGEPSQRFSYYFYITAPTLGHYRYLLLSIFHDFDLYPVNIDVGQDIKQELGFSEDSYVANNEEEFKKLLSQIFNSQKARKVISALLSQVESA